MVTVDTSADISGSSTETLVDSRSTVDRHVSRVSVEGRSSNDISTDASVDVSVEVRYKIHDPFSLHFHFNCTVFEESVLEQYYMYSARKIIFKLYQTHDCVDLIIIISLNNHLFNAVFTLSNSRTPSVSCGIK